MENNIKPTCLVVMDGVGLSAVTKGNAFYSANTPFFDKLLTLYPSSSISASGVEVGLEFGEMGNSEVGHLNLGTGRVIMQNLPRINLAINNKSFFVNKDLLYSYNIAKKNNSTLHLLGLASVGGIHAHLDHLFALLDLAKSQKIKNIAIHVITDGRDTPPKKALDYIARIEKKIASISGAKIASICGRYYMMDRDSHWLDRTKLAYELLTEGKGKNYENYQDAINSSYKSGESDETIPPIILDNKLILKENDVVVFYNFRSDRAKQIVKSIIDPDFSNFKRNIVIKKIHFVCFTNYGFEPSGNVKIAFFSEIIKNTLARVLAGNRFTQLHIAETEKYAHVTYFFNGGVEKPHPLESRILVPSPRVKSYDLKPEMSAVEVTNKFINYFNKHKPLFSVINFANADMVGHTGNLKATIKAIEIIDHCLKTICSNISDLDANIIITADHGNAEQMINPETNEIDKEHTTNPVPVILYGNKKQNNLIDKLTLASSVPTGVLADIAPTILDYLGISKPVEMNGQSLREII